MEGKRAAPSDAADAPPAKKEATLGEKLKRQVEYYYSDENLKHDSFFQPKISSDPDFWMPMENLLSCRRIQNLGATEDDLIKAVEDSTSVQVMEKDGVKGIRRLQAPPALEPQKDKQEKPKKEKRAVDDFHAAGCVVKAENLPEEATWETFKKALLPHLPEPRIIELTEAAASAGKKPCVEQPIQFISNPQTGGTCYALLMPFEGDRAKFGPPGLKLDINGAEVTVIIVSDANEAHKFLRGLPRTITRRREREIAHKRKQLNSTPINVAGFDFNSVDHLRKCLREVLNQHSPGQVVNQKTNEVLKALLRDYHPNGQAKLVECVDFKVDLLKREDGPPSRCFFVIKQNGSAEVSLTHPPNLNTSRISRLQINE